MLQSLLIAGLANRPAEKTIQAITAYIAGCFHFTLETDLSYVCMRLHLWKARMCKHSLQPREMCAMRSYPRLAKQKSYSAQCFFNELRGCGVLLRPAFRACWKICCLRGFRYEGGRWAWRHWAAFGPSSDRQLRPQNCRQHLGNGTTEPPYRKGTRGWRCCWCRFFSCWSIRRWRRSCWQRVCRLYYWLGVWWDRSALRSSILGLLRASRQSQGGSRAAAAAAAACAATLTSAFALYPANRIVTLQVCRCCRAGR